MRAYLLTLLVFANSIGAAIALEFDEECLVLSSVKEGRREAFATDGLLNVIARDGFAAPKAGDMVPHESGKEAPWRSATYKDGELILPKSNDEDTERG
ncbi:MAG: hypothetical protein KDN22_00380 [Verrucomicrobiae bacterium]|nr:hypothetical protein [Verrucomicrobiae bacterium]